MRMKENVEERLMKSLVDSRLRGKSSRKRIMNIVKCVDEGNV